MTPKEKAEILVRSFGYKIGKEFKNGGFRFNIEIAIQCALIAVDEILDLTKSEIWVFDEETKQAKMEYVENSYWVEVKQEIQKL